jgi:hypothetical protein
MMSTEIQDQLTPQENYWFKALKESKKSRITQKLFCREKGIDYEEFKKWRTVIYRKMGKFSYCRRRKKSVTHKKIDWIPVKIKPSAMPSPKEYSAIKIAIRDIDIFIEPGFDRSTLKHILEVIR